MRLVALLACGLLTACTPGAKASTATSCRESDGPRDCKPLLGIGAEQGGYLEGEGLDRLRFKVPTGAFPPAPGTKLKGFHACSGAGLHVAMGACTPIPDRPGPGAFTCQVDVISAQSGAAAVPAVTPICVTRLEDRIADPDPTHHRGVTVVRGFWDATGAWQDAPNIVTLSCDARGNAPGIHQFDRADGAITKCLRTFQLDPQLSSDAFLACIRMLRADYCGDGHPRTYAGTHVNLATPQNPMTSAECNDGQCFEASWSKHGAVCIARPRWTGRDLELQACRDQFVPNGALLCREQPEQGVVFSRSAQHVCGHVDPVECSADHDPVCGLIN